MFEQTTHGRGKCSFCARVYGCWRFDERARRPSTPNRAHSQLRGGGFALLLFSSISMLTEEKSPPPQNMFTEGTVANTRSPSNHRCDPSITGRGHGPTYDYIYIYIYIHMRRGLVHVPVWPQTGTCTSLRSDRYMYQSEVRLVHVPV